MASRASLNKVLLIGNLTRDPELRYTPSGAAVCTFGVATNRTYVASDGTRKEEAEFIKIVSWNKLAELCSQLLTKGRKVYVEGRLQTRTWETPDGQNRQITEVVIDDMRILDSKKSFEESAGYEDAEPHEDLAADQSKSQDSQAAEPKTSKKQKTSAPAADSKDNKEAPANDKIDLEDLPF